MKKISTKILGVILTIGLLAEPITGFSQAVPQTAPQNAAFTDINVGDNHYVAIKFLKDRNVIQGYEDGTFQPDREITRAEALKIILGTLNKAPDPTEKNSTKTFIDVHNADWFAANVKQGIENGIVSGYNDGHFYPNQTINRAESLKMVLLQENNELPVSIDQPPYSDVPVDAWFAPYAEVSKERGLFLEARKDGSLSPDQTLNRGDFAELIYRLLESTNGYTFGRATYYSDSLAGHGTSSGDPYNPGVFTVAHKTLPFGTMLRVTNLANGQSVDVKVNDRGPYATGVELDLSKSAFSAIAAPSTGIIVTQYQILQQPSNG